MSIVFTINGKLYQVSEDIPADTSLTTFIRNHAHLSGTKFMCLEGGCGVCIVNITKKHPVTHERISYSANSCLISIFSCHETEILTAEGLGSRADGYHPIQRRLAMFNGSQCGFCSPGFVMSMFSKLRGNPNARPSMEELEKSLDSNICRCTGYRPILDTFKSFASDADEKLRSVCQDVEDLEPRYDKVWYIARSLSDILSILKTESNRPYMLVAGNTGNGVYRRSPDLEVFIDVNLVEELRGYKIERKLTVGANITFTEFIDVLREAASNDVNFSYCLQIAEHMEMVAHTAVRNVGTLAGNLCLKYQNPQFTSDIFIILEAVGAMITIVSPDNTVDVVAPLQFLRYNMKGKVLTEIALLPLDPKLFRFQSYSVQTRAQNAIALVNGAFVLKIDNHDTPTIQHASICFGGIHPTFTHATKTESELLGKQFGSNETLQRALGALESELTFDWVLPDPSPEFRRLAALGMLYRLFLSIGCHEDGLVDPRFVSGIVPIERPLSSGSQLFDTYPQKWPVSQSIPKVEGLIQTSAEAKYINDLPSFTNELYASFVIATKPHRRIVRIDPGKALQMDGVEAFFSAKDIPGKNDFMPFYNGRNHYFPLGFNRGITLRTDPEEIFCSEYVLYHGQPVGIVLARSFDIANRAASLIEIEYSEKMEKEVKATLEDIYATNAKDRLIELPHGFTGPAFNDGTTGSYEANGTFRLEGQFHFSMENQLCICVPTEDNGMDVYTSTQWLHQVQLTISEVLKIPQNTINYYCTRVGGSFGAKMTRSAWIAGACALGAHLTRRPVRFIMSLEGNMTTVGKRQGLMVDYKVSVDEQGKILKLINNFTYDLGSSTNETLDFIYRVALANCYDNSTWKLTPYGGITDTASNIWLRSPGFAEAIFSIETIMDHIAHQSKLDPVAVRLANIPAANSEMTELLAQFVVDVDYHKRKTEIEKFNQQNRWRKRGIAIVPGIHPVVYYGNFDALVSIHHLDGSVSITHSGVELGQGINTKAVQVAAYTLGIPKEKISIKRISSITSPNGTVEVASSSSENVASAVINACQMLMDRIKPIREMNPSLSWEALAHACFAANISLTAHYATNLNNFSVYNVSALACAEVELDVLSGAIRLSRVDILEDTGESLSPGVDIGQIEGAFIMGIGYLLTEKLVYDPATGELLNNRSWNYKPPGAKDIPTDFRIRFLKKASNPVGVLGSKATGEPAYNLAISALNALRYALEAARKDAGLPDEWITLGILFYGHHVQFT
ncbi:probable aldehyde oxidase gad-3 [Uranotaenia lowii]|uniref:probable aldehyde oxidase gad-3 n=1 Tax=Uranotaenia lowii TaxID=190385 RepID=UPI00247A4B8A|nr:probable aldehyde oxidase gad-3 [Uranotaenia lowii]